MAKKPDVWMPFYGDDFQADTGHCTAAERGAYHDLLWACWKRKNALPTDDAQLMRLARCTPSEWKHARLTVMAFFYREEDVYRHKRVAVELAIATSRYEAKVKAGKEGGKASGKARAKQTGSENEADVQAEPKQMGTQLQPHSPSGESRTLAGSVENTPKSVKGTRLGSDWKPNESGRKYAHDRNLTDGEIDGAVLPKFIRVFTSPDLKKPVRKGWDRTWCNFVDDEAPRVISRRPGGGQSGRYRQGPGSVLAALGQIMGARETDSHGMGRASDDEEVQPGTGESTTTTCGDDVSSGAYGGGVVIEGQFTDVPDDAGGDEIPHAAKGRAH